MLFIKKENDGSITERIINFKLGDLCYVAKKMEARVSVSFVDSVREEQMIQAIENRHSK